MKVVLFCGGLPLRLTEQDRPIPKPMMMIGYRPILWHVMRMYAHWGLDDFVLCLGYGGDAIKRYFLNYSEALSNDFVLSGADRSVQLMSSDIAGWRITFADTGIHSSIGERLRAVRHHLGDAEIFCANYGDVLTDAPLDALVDDFQKRDRIAAFMSVRPPTEVGHLVTQAPDGSVKGMEHVSASDLWVNGGFFIFRQRIFDFLVAGDDLAGGAFARLIDDGQLITYRHDGFYVSMDTLRDLQTLEALQEEGRAPWAVWLGDQSASD